MEDESDQTGIRIMENSSWIQCEAPKIAKLVYNSNKLWFMVLITIVTGANLNQLTTGGPHIVDMV